MATQPRHCEVFFAHQPIRASRLAWRRFYFFPHAVSRLRICHGPVGARSDSRILALSSPSTAHSHRTTKGPAAVSACIPSSSAPRNAASASGPARETDRHRRRCCAPTAPVRAVWARAKGWCLAVPKPYHRVWPCTHTTESHYYHYPTPPQPSWR